MGLRDWKNVFNTARRGSQPPEHGGGTLRIEAEIKNIDFELVTSTRKEINDHLLERIKGGNGEKSDFFSWKDMSSGEKMNFERLFERFATLESGWDRREWKEDFKKECEWFWKNGSGRMWRNGCNPDHDKL